VSGAPASPREAIATALEHAPGEFSFAQVIRLLQRLHPERARLGGWADPQREVARLGVPPSLSFPGTEVSQVRLPEEGEAVPPRVAARFLGLTGVQGVLPHDYTVWVAQRARQRDTAPRDFLDLFQHRLLSLYHRTWEKHRPVLAAERGDDDHQLAHLLDLAGVGTPGLAEASGLPRELLGFYAGLLAHRSRPALGLAQLVGDYFGVPASVEQFVGEWRSVAGSGQLRLGETGDDGRLGRAVVGDAVYDPQGRVRLRVGPLTRRQFDALLPDGADHDRLRALVRVYVEDGIGVDAQLVLARDEGPATALGHAGAPTLGRGSWLLRRAPTRDPDDVCIPLC
jgi:type VI secretion system protein ImpH